MYGVEQEETVIQTENSSHVGNFNGKVHTDGGLPRGKYGEMTTQELPLQVEGHMQEGQAEIQHGGYIQMTSESMSDNLGSQMQVQMIGEQQISSVQMNGEGIMMMQSQVNGEQQFCTQEGTYTQMASQELSMDSQQASGETLQMQSQGFSQGVLTDGQMAQGQKFIGGDNSGQILAQEMQMQNMGITDMSIVGSGQYGGQVIQSEGGVIQGTEVGYGETIILEMTVQGMNDTGVRSQGIMTQEMQLGMNSETMQMQGISMTESEMQFQEMSMQNVQNEGVEGVIYLEGGEIQGEQLQISEMAMGGMSLEMNGQEMQMQEISMQQIPLDMQSQEIGFVVGGEPQMSEMAIEEVGFVEGGEIQMSGMSMQEVGYVNEDQIQQQQFQMSEMSMPLEMNGQEMQMQEMSVQQMPLEMQSQESGIVECGALQSEQFQMSEMTIQEMPLDMNGQEMQMQEISMQQMPLDVQSQEAGFVEGGKLQTREMTIQEVGFVEGEEIQMSGMSIQEVGYVKGGEIQQQQFQMSEMSMPLEMNGQEMQMQEMSVQQMPLEMQSQESGIVECGALQSEQFQMSEMTIQEMPLDMNGQEMQMQEISMQQMPLDMQSQETGFVEGGELQTSEMTIQEVGFVEGEEIQMSGMSIQEVGYVKGGEIQQQQFQMSETSMSEMPFEMNELGMQMQEMSVQQMPLEMQSQETESVESGALQSEQFQMSELAIQEMPLDMNSQEISMQKMSMTEMSMQDMSIQVISTEEMPMQEISVQEMSTQAISVQEMHIQDMTVQEMPIQEMSMQEVSTEEMSVQEIPIQEMPIEEFCKQEMPLQQMIAQEMSLQEMPLKMQEIGVMEVSEIQQEETQLSEMSIQEMPLETQEAGPVEGGELQQEESQLTGITVEEMPLEIQHEETGLDEGSQDEEQQEMPLQIENQEIGPIEESEIVTQQFSMSEMTRQDKPLDMNQQQISIEEMPLELQGEEIWVSTAEMTAQEIPLDMASQEIMTQETDIQETKSYEISSTKEEDIQEIQLPWEEVAGQEIESAVENEVVQISSAETLSEIQSEEIRYSQEVESHVQLPLEEISELQEIPLDTRNGQEQSSQVENNKEQTMVSNVEAIAQDASAVVTEKVSCDHTILIDQFFERITRLEKEKEYLQGRYDELQHEKDTSFMAREDQVTTRDDHHHCCDIEKDYSTLIEYMTSPRENHSDVHECVHNHTCYIRGAKENRDTSTQVSADYEYYKSKCDQMKHEKERLQRAYETEKRQREEFEREYQNENDEKAYLEERYQEMLDTISRFDETIRSLRRDNELLQSSLNDLAKSRIVTQTLEMNSTLLEQGENGTAVTEYKRSIQALEKENREFRTILDVLSKKNESQESLKNIELGLTRENEFIELKRERARLESCIKEMNRTNNYQQQRIEEIRRESTTEISRLKEKHRKLERSLKDTERAIEEKEEEICNLKKRHSEEIQGMEMRLQTELSSAIRANNQIKDLNAKIQRLEEERGRLREELRTSSVSGRDRYAEMNAENQDFEVLRQRFEDERRSKMRLASDMKYLLSDIMDLKERNQRLQEDFARERIEIKAMIEKQANEITQEYLTQINKVQRSLIEETKRRQDAEAGRYGLVTNQDNSSSLISGQREMNARTNWGNSELQQQLNNEIRQRETLEIENKKLLYKINDFLSGGNSHNEEALDNFKNKTPTLTQNDTKVTRDNKEREVNQRELQSEIEDLQEKLEDLKKEAKRNKDLKRKNEELEEELTHLTRKRDELLAAQRNLTREVDHLSRTLEEVERRNRKFSDETERLTRKMQDIEDSFRQEKITLARTYENEKAKAVEEVKKLKEACEKRLQTQTDTTIALEEKILHLQQQMLTNDQTQSGRTNGVSSVNTTDPYKVSGDSRNQATFGQDDKLKKEVQSLEALLKDVNKKHADDIRNLEIQKQRMSEEFQREKESLERYFEKEKESLQKRLRHVESSIRGGGTSYTGAVEQVNEAFPSNPGRPSPVATGKEDDMQMDLKSTVKGTARYVLNPAENGVLEKKVKDLQRRFNEEKEEILNRASKEKTKLEEEVREAKEKLTSYRRLLEDEMDDLKRKHRKELDYLNDKLVKERAEVEERIRINRNGYPPKNGISTQRKRFSSDDDNTMGGEQQRLNDELERQKSALTSKFDKDKSQLQSEKKKLMETIHALTKEVNALKCEKRESKDCYKQEKEKLARIHDVEKMTILQRASRDKDEELSRIKDDYEEKLSSQGKKLQAIIDDLRREMSLTERKVKDMEMQKKNERMRYQEEKTTAEKSLIQSREELKMTMEREYQKMLKDQKLKFEQTINALTKQISFLQDQRKAIQAKLLSNELSGNSRINTEQLTRSSLAIQMEREFLERSEGERRKFEVKINDLQQKISKLKREKTELKTTLENEKQELEEELEKMREDLRRKLSKARHEMERKTDVIGKIMLEDKVKNILGCSSVSSHHSTQCDLRQYKDQINLMEQRNMTLQAKTERLERELRVMGDRLRTLETRNKDLETANREEWSINRNDTLRLNLGSLGESEFRGGNDLSLGSNLAGLRSEARVFQPSYSPTLNNTNGQSLINSGQSYGDILQKVRYTMQATGSISDALGGPMAGTGGLSNAAFIAASSVGIGQSEALSSGSFNQAVVNSLGSGNIVGSVFPGNAQFVAGNANENATAGVVRSTLHDGEGSHQPAPKIP